MEGQLGSLVVSLSADIAQFQSDLGRANRIAEQHVAQVTKTFDGVRTVVTTLVGGAMAEYIKSLVDAAEATNRLSERTGHAVGYLSELQVVAAQNGVSVEGLTTSLDHFNVSLTAASDKTSKQAQLFKALGVDITQGPTEAFKAFARNASAIDDAATKTAVFKEVFGKAGAELIPVAKGLDAATEAAHKMGGTLAEEAAKGAERLNNALGTLSAVSKIAITNAIEPGITAFATMAENIAKAAEKGEKWIQVMREAVKVSASLVGGGARLLNGGGDNVITSGAEGVFRAFSPELRGPGVQFGRPTGAPVLPPNTKNIQGIITGGNRPGASDEDKKALENLKYQLDAQARLRDEYEKTQGEINTYATEQGLEQIKIRVDAEKAADASIEKSRQETADLLQAQNEAISRGELQDQADRAKAAQEAFKRQEQMAKKVDSAAHQLGITFESAFEKAILAGGRLRDLMQSLAQDILRIALRTAVTEPIAAGVTSGVRAGLGNLFGGPSLSEAQASDGTIAGFATGGEFTVPGGSGGVDTSVVKFRATPGEKVTVSSPGRSGGSGLTIGHLDMRGASIEAVNRLEALVHQVNGSIESRAIAAVSGKSRARGQPVFG